MRIWITASILFLFFLAGCYAARVDGPYRGRVIDGDTGKPIPGVVALGTWDREYIGPGGATHSYYDAMETVTDKNGDFEIKGQGLLVMSNVIPMDVLIFKAGYTYLGVTTWRGLESMSEKDNDRIIIQLKKFTMEQRMRQGSPDYPSEAPAERIKLMLGEINKDRAERGLQPVN